MEYSEFLEHVRVKSMPIAKDGGTVLINHVIKNNGCEFDGLVITEKDSRVSPTIYLNSYYDDYKGGREIEDIVNDIHRIYIENKDRITVNPNDFMDFDKIKSTIVYKLINYEKNEKLLESVPHKRMLDLAIVYYCLLIQDDDSNATALIYNKNMEKWNVTLEDIHDNAVRNTPRLLATRISPMSSLIDEVATGISPKDIEYTFGEMYVLTNTSRINGAACMLYGDVLKDCADRIGKDLYILPSSIHEVILLPQLEIYKKEELCDMVREVNSVGVSREEILSDNVYIYNRKEHKIML